MFQCLLLHGCVDLSSSIDHEKYSQAAITGGSFGDIWLGKMLTGEDIAIKCLRFHSLVEDGPKGLKVRV